MKKRLILSLALVSTLLVSHTTIADTGFCDRRCAQNRTFIIFAGGGVIRAQSDLNSTVSNSRFIGWGWNAETGIEFPLGDKWAFRAAATFGKTDYLNTANGRTIVETGANTYFNGKFMLMNSLFGIGGGYRKNNIQINNLAEGRIGVTNEYSGYVPFGLVNFSMVLGDRVGMSVEGQYHFGSFGSTNFREISGQINLMLLFQVR